MNIHRHIKDNVIIYKPSIPIFPDDTIITVITKISLDIANVDKTVNLSSIPYVWYKNKCLRFEENSKYPINPWDSKNIVYEHNGVKYNDNLLLNSIISFDNKSIDLHIVFAHDLMENTEHYNKVKDYYYPDISIKWKLLGSYTSIKTEADVLKSVWDKTNESELKVPFIYSKVNFIGQLKQYNYTLSELFESINVTKDQPFIQYIEDTSKILYKVYKQHTISSVLFNEWTLYENIPKTAIIIIYFRIKERKDLYARVSIDTNGQVYLKFTVDIRDKLEYSIINDYNKKIKKWIETFIASKLYMKIESVYLKGDFKSDSKIGIRDLANTISKLHPIYHLIKMGSGQLEVAFKRSMNFKSKIDIGDYISTRNRLGIPLPEIMNDLIELGMSPNDVSEWIQQYQSQIESDANDIKMPKKSLLYTGCILTFTRTTIGFKVQFDNVGSFDEVNTLTHWIISTLKSIIIEKVNKKLPAIEEVPANLRQRIVIEDEESSSSKKSSSKSKDVLREDIGDLDDFEFGGAVGKQNRGYFLQLLQQTDPSIFLEHKPYAKECLANNFRQPIVLTDAEKKEIDSKGYKYDNIVEYGSDIAHKNHYICPRIWCPTSRLPLTPEQLKDNDGKCPGPHNEKPILMYDDNYWDKNDKIPHYIGFLKDGEKKTNDNFCLPCCMKKPLKPSALEQCKIPSSDKDEKPSKIEPVIVKKEVKKDKEVKDTGYIMTTPSPLPPDRYGIIPKDLYFYLYPDKSWLTCSKAINTSECLLRKGLKIEGGDTLLNSIAYVLGGNSNKLISFIEHNLDPIKFISIENGLLLQSFMDDNVLYPSHNIKLKNNWQKWLLKHNNYKTLINYSSEYMLSRELAIYKAFCNLINHLRSNEKKNPIHLINILGALGIQLVIFTSNAMNTATISCPTFSHISELLYKTAAKSQELIMIIEDTSTGVYEPLELKQSNKQGITKFKLNDFKPLKELLSKCPTKEPLVPFIEIMRNLNSWTDISLQSPHKFKIDRVILRPDLRINGFITTGNIILVAPTECYPVSILTHICKLLPIKHILYHEDIQNKEYDIEGVLLSDLDLFSKKVEVLGLGISLGTIIDTKRNIFKSKLVIPSINKLVPPIIKCDSANNNKLYDIHERIEGQSRRWYQIQLTIGKELLKYYETLVQPLLTRTRKERINILMNTFPSIPQKDIIQVTLEEMPLDNKQSLAKWMNSINIYDRASIYYNTDVIEKEKTWVFSQAAVTYGINPIVLNMGNKTRLKDKVDLNTNTIDLTGEILAPEKLPKILDEKFIKIENMPSKWSQIKTYSYSKYRIYKANEYTITDIPEMMVYLAKILFVPFIYKELENIRFKEIIPFLETKDKAQYIFNDKNMINIWNKSFKKKHKTFDLLWDSNISKISFTERIEKWKLIYIDSDIWTTDIDFYIFAKLLDINILMIQRQKYGAGQENKRGEIEDLFVSSSFYPGSDVTNWKNRPCIILYRSETSKCIEFSAIVNENKEFMVKGADLPDDINKLFIYHINHKK